MKPRLTCDDVFDHLTRAPFPTGADTDQLVDDHLAVCHDCRKMAEALRPATDLFQEVLSAEQRRSLPAYRGQLETVARDERPRCRSMVATLEPRNRRAVGSHATSRYRQWYLLPALALVLLLMIAILRGSGIHDSSGNGHTNALAAIGSGGPDHAVTCLLAGFTLPQDCLPRSIVGPARPRPLDATAVKSPQDTPPHLMACLNCHETVHVTAASVVCCTNCHSAGSVPTKPAKTLFPRLAKSCAACHEKGIGEHGAGIRS